MAGDLDFDFNHVHIFCSDLAATERWLVDGIGATVMERRDSRGAPAVELRLAGTRLLIRSGRDGEGLVPAGARHFGTDHFGLGVKDLDSTAAELKRRGVEFEMEPQLFRPGVRIAFVKGPDNVRIELVESSQ
jgi:catechol 2,3-dioxygenase-like lactoylglutathione lyase family enzyme